MYCQRTKDCLEGDNISRKVQRQFAKFLAILALICVILQHLGHPISCWTPAEFTSPMTTYANSYCYSSDIYYAVPDEFVPTPPETPHVNRFKWTPYVLLLIAVIYWIPEIATNLLEKTFPPHLNSIVGLSHQSVNGTHDSRAAAIKSLVREAQRRLDSKVKGSSHMGASGNFSKRLLTLRTSIHLKNIAIKIILTLGSVLPLLLVGGYFVFPATFHKQTFVDSEGVNNTTLFPTNIFCYFTIRRFAKVHTYSVQCKVSGNELFEKLSISVCFMIVAVSTSCLGDVIHAICAPFFERFCCDYNHHLEVPAEVKREKDIGAWNDFVNNYLKIDGVFLMALICRHASDHVAEQVLAGLFEKYKISEKAALKPMDVESETFKNSSSPAWKQNEVRYMRL